MDPKDPKRNQCVRYLAPGIWEDAAGGVHIGAEEINAHLGVPNTPEEMEDTMRVMEQWLREELPHAKIVKRRTPND